MAATGLYLEHYLESLESLPNELQRNFHNMRDLDQTVQDTMRNIDKISDDFLKNVKNLSPEKRTEYLSKIQKLYNRATEDSDDKVQIATQTYELVDKHIRRLDSDLAKFEAEIKEKSITSSKKDDEPGTKKKGKGRKKKEEKNKFKKKGGAQSDDDEAPPVSKVGRKKKIKNLETESAIASVLPGLSIAHPSDVLDMPVDPNEPTYCLCHQVSYGEMIACDKPDCPIEWFHFACVGLTTKPKGKWYCPKCTTERKKK